MTGERETRTVKDLLGDEHEYIYEGGKRVGEYRLEDRGGVLGFGSERHKVEYDADDREVGYSRQERRGGVLGFGGEEVEASYRRDRSRAGYSRVEERGGFLGIGSHHARIGYDEDGNEISSTQWERRGGVLGFGERHARVTRYSGRRGERHSSSRDADLGDLLGKLIVGAAVVCFIIWLVFAVLLPLAFINTAALALAAAIFSARRRGVWMHPTGAHRRMKALAPQGPSTHGSTTTSLHSYAGTGAVHAITS